MLLSLNITNYAIIDSLSVDFNEGLNVLTGETGAGKSIIIGALSLALGYRGNIDSVRSGADKASVQALFTLPKNNEQLSGMLADNDISFEDGTLLFKRELFANGRNVCRINDTIVTVNTLKAVSMSLIDIHGQHEHQKLLSSDTHLGVVDSFGKSEIETVKAEVFDAYENMKAAKAEYKRLLKESENAKEEQEKCLKTKNEIETANLKENEDEELEARFRFLQNSEKIFENVRNVYGHLYTSESSVTLKMSSIIAELENILRYDDTLTETYKSLSDAAIAVEEAVITVRDYKERIEYDPEELDDIQDRLNRITKLKRKYGETVPDILAEKDAAIKKLSEILDLDAITINAENAYRSCFDVYVKKASELSDRRKEVACELSEKLCDILNQLAMPNTRFSVKFEKLEESRYSKDGFDTVEFFISTNAGQDMKPLSKIASGGEISRIMLAVKCILADTDKTDTLIFDEIDTGISGRTAQTVAEKMSELAASHQIISITHLPQLASMADSHYIISKYVKDGNTYTTFNIMNRQERIQELARMLGGVEVTESAQIHAAEMLELADEYKAKR